jgi:hypothetical protein
MNYILLFLIFTLCDDQKTTTSFITDKQRLLNYLFNEKKYIKTDLPPIPAYEKSTKIFAHLIIQHIDELVCFEMFNLNANVLE